MSAENCLHCAGPLPAEGIQVVCVDGRRQGVCSAACASAAETIAARGLTDFYRFRERPEGPPGEADPDLGRWSGYDRPALQTEFVTTAPDGSRMAHLLLGGVRCAACAWLIERGIGPIDGVLSIAVNPVSTRADIRWDPSRIRLSQLMSQIARLGFSPFPHTDEAVEQAAVVETRRSLRRLIVAGLGMMQVTTYAVALYAGAFQGMDAQIERFFRLVSLLVATPIVWYSGAPFFAGAWRDLKARSPGMDVPVALAIGAAWSASVWNTLIGHGEVYFDSATMFVFFLSAARHLEMTGRHRVMGLTDAYARHLPRIATRLVDGEPREVGVMELEPGDTVLVSPGQTFPADGILEDGPVQVDEALLTGESEPVLKPAGARVVAGSINQRTAARLTVEHIGADTELAQIACLMSAAQADKPRIVRVANRIASKFVTAVLFSAVFVGLAWWMIAPERAFEIVLAVLVVTCPCALAIATPAAFTVAMSALARDGFLLRRSGALEVMSRVTDILFDKTGTLTDRELTLRHVEPADGFVADDVIKIATALEAQSEHPIARAFAGRASGAPARQVEARAGEGLEGEVDGRRYRIGARAFVSALSGADASAAFDASPPPAMRSVYLGHEQAVVARFDLGEAARDGAALVVRELRAAGIWSRIASGDHARTAADFATRLGLDDCHAGLRPADKLELLRELQADGRTVAMVGDGINDSPVLAGANVSIAMGSGTSLAQHSADGVLMHDNLATLTQAFAMARRTMRIVRQNLCWAIGYNVIALPLAASGMLAPWMAALGMSASSLLVTGNALRLSRQSSQGGASSADETPGFSPAPAEPVA